MPPAAVPLPVTLPPGLSIAGCYHRCWSRPLCLSVLSSRAGFLPNFTSENMKEPHFCLNPVRVLRCPATSTFTRGGIRRTTCQVSPFFWSKMCCQHPGSQSILFLPWRLFFSLAPCHAARDKPGASPRSPNATGAPYPTGLLGPANASSWHRSLHLNPSGFKPSKILSTAGCCLSPLTSKLAHAQKRREKMALLETEMYTLSLGADLRRLPFSEIFSSYLNILAEKQVFGYKCAAGRKLWAYRVCCLPCKNRAAFRLHR